MPVTQGQHLGAVRTLEDLRERCVMSTTCDCWHLRTPYGRQITRQATFYVWVHGHGLIAMRRAAWFLARGTFPIAGRRVHATCDSHDCVNPAHLRAWTRKEHGAWLRKTGGVELNAAQRLALRLNANHAKKLTDEVARWALESPQSIRECAHALDVSKSMVEKIRSKQRRVEASAVSSVFALGAAVNDSLNRAAA